MYISVYVLLQKLNKKIWVPPWLFFNTILLTNSVFHHNSLTFHKCQQLSIFAYCRSPLTVDCYRDNSKSGISSWSTGFSWNITFLDFHEILDFWWFGEIWFRLSAVKKVLHSTHVLVWQGPKYLAPANNKIRFKWQFDQGLYYGRALCYFLNCSVLSRIWGNSSGIFI